jgi:hypothetical protein
MCVKCLQPVDSLLNVRICHHFACQSGASYGGKDMEITRSEIQTAWEVFHNLLAIVLYLLTVWGPVISISLDTLRSTWLGRKFATTLPRSKLSPPAYKHTTPISSTPGYKPSCHDRTNTKISMVNTWRSGV